MEDPASRFIYSGRVAKYKSMWSQERKIRLAGFELPAIGFGTCYLTSVDLYDAALAAMRLGYRLIDSAAAYENEEALGILTCIHAYMHTHVLAYIGSDLSAFSRE